MVSKHVSDGLGVDIPDLLSHFLLHTPRPFTHYKQSALPHLLNAARRLIPIYWKSLRISSKVEWMGMVGEIMDAEEWLATCRGTQKGLDSIWASWRDHISGSLSVSSSFDTALLALADPKFRQLLLANLSVFGGPDGMGWQWVSADVSAHIRPSIEQNRLEGPIRST